MNEKQAGEYLKKLVERKGAGLEGLEAEAWKMFVEASGRIEQTEKQVRIASREVEQGRVMIQKTLGAREAFIGILVTAEMQRQQQFKSLDTPPPASPGNMDLEDLKKMTGADRVEATDLDGTVLASSEDVLEDRSEKPPPRTASA